MLMFDAIKFNPSSNVFLHLVWQCKVYSTLTLIEIGLKRRKAYEKSWLNIRFTI